MTPSEDLFELIKSLSASEKGYIKKRAQSFRGTAQNLRLFSLIEKQKVYDEMMLKQSIRTKGENGFAMAKNYLYQFILESLELYHKDSPAIKVKSFLNAAEILSAKGLYTQASKAVKKAKLLAKKYELKKELIEIADWEIQFLMAKNQTKEIFGEIEQLQTEYKHNLSDLEAISNSKFTFHYVRSQHLVIGMARNLGETKIIQALLKSNSSDKKIHAGNFYAQFYYFFTLSIYYFTKNDFRLAYHFVLKIKQLWERFPQMAKLVPDLYIYYITRRALFEDRLGLNKKVFATLNHGHIFIKATKNISNKTRSNFYIFHLGMCNQNGLYDNSLKVINETELFRKTLNNGRFVDSEEQLYLVTAGDTYFEIGDFKKANQLVNQVIDLKFHYREDIYCFAFVKSILVHFELNNTDLLEYKIKTTIQLLKKHKRLHQSEELILNFIRKQIKNYDTNSIPTEEYVLLKKKLVEILQNSLEANILNYFDFVTWIDAKTEKKSFEYIKRLRLNQRKNQKQL